MGGEFGSWNEWNHHQSLDWNLLADKGGLNSGVQKLTKKLNQLYQSEPALHELDCVEEGFQWLIQDDREQSVLAFVRYDKGGQPLVILHNMTPEVHHDYQLGVPVSGRYKVLLNSDARYLWRERCSGWQRVESPETGITWSRVQFESDLATSGFSDSEASLNGVTGHGGSFTQRL